MIKQTLKYYRQLNAEVPGLRTVVITHPEELMAAKELHARVYRALGIVTDADLTADGRCIGTDEDPHQQHAQYFGVQELGAGNPRTVAAARVIYADPGKGLESFPTYVSQALHPQCRSLLEGLSPAACGEISALVREPGTSGKATLMLYRAIWHYALGRRFARLLVSCDARLYRRCKMIFGASWMRAGPDGYSRNVRVVPVIVDIPGSLDEALKVSRANPVKRRVKLRALEFFVRGLPEESVLPSQRAKLARYRLDTAAPEEAGEPSLPARHDAHP
jgi:hypothetical protein